MKTISVSVEDETHRLARTRAAETGTTVSAMIREMLLATLKQPAEPGTVETEPENGPGYWTRSLRGSGRKASAWTPANS